MKYVLVIDVFDGFLYWFIELCHLVWFDGSGTGLLSYNTWHGLTVLVLVYRFVSLGVV